MKFKLPLKDAKFKVDTLLTHSTALMSKMHRAILRNSHLIDMILSNMANGYYPGKMWERLLKIFWFIVSGSLLKDKILKKEKTGQKERIP